MNQADLSLPMPGHSSLVHLFVSEFGRINRFSPCLGVMSVCDTSVQERGCVKAYSHWEVGAPEDGAARGDVMVQVCMRHSDIVCQQARTWLSPPPFVPFMYTGLYVRDYPGFCCVLQPFHL